MTYEKRNLWRPSEVTGVYAASDGDDARMAVATADKAFPDWASLPAQQRGVFLRKAASAIEDRAEHIARDMTAEMGKPLRESRLEALRAATILRHAAGDAWRPEPTLLTTDLIPLDLGCVDPSLGVLGDDGRKAIMKLREFGPPLVGEDDALNGDSTNSSAVPHRSRFRTEA